MIIITSASYINQEFSSEFGLIPPAFLPVGNKRLYNYQVASLPAGERRILTVPEAFSVSPHDQARLDELEIEVLHIPPNLSLGESVVCAINLSGNPLDAPLRILHGDTLIEDLPGDLLDVITLSEVDGAYNWATWHDADDELLTQLEDSPMVGRVRIANGYFAFSDCGLLVRSVIRSAGNFIQGVNAYSRECPLAPADVEKWLDFGHGHTFYRSKARMTTQRAFNNLQIGPRVVSKSSRDAQKMQAEYHWFSSLPDDLRIFTPQLIRSIKGPDIGYEIQYLYLASLNELHVFGQLPRFVWRTIFQGCFAFLEACRLHQPADPISSDPSILFYDKTRERLALYHEATGIDLDQPWSINGIATPSLNEIIARTAEMIPRAADEMLCVVHGDFCFSNILYDFRAQAIKVIDPRGRMPDGTVSLFGDQRYDLAKLAHSVCGLYDFIVAGYYTVEADGQALKLELPGGESIVELQALFLAMVEEYFSIEKHELYAMQVHLFLSMIPMHADDPGRQKAFLANALRLYTELS
jgi:hypothetical protein